MESTQSENQAEPTDPVQLPISVDCIKQENTEEEVSQDEQENSSCSNSHVKQEEEEASACNYIEPCNPAEIVIGGGQHRIIDIHTVVRQEELEGYVPMVDVPIEAGPEQYVPVVDVPIEAGPEQAINPMPAVIPRRRRRRSFLVPMVPSQHSMVLRNRRSTLYSLRKLI